jgi:hypothetical protein
VSARRIAICQHPHGEGVWWDTAGHPHSGCIQLCDCTPIEYVRADAYQEAVGALEEVVRASNTVDPADFRAEAVRIAGTAIATARKQ